MQVSNSNSYKIVFEGVRGSSYQGDIALDDIELQNKACPPTINCDFESPVSQLKLCGWTQRSDDNFNWTLGQGTTSSINTGPSNDHTLGDQRGIFFNKQHSFECVYQKQILSFS